MQTVEELKLRMEAFSLWLASQSMSRVAESLSVPRKTIESWAEEDSWKDKLSQVSEQMYSYIIADYSRTLFNVWQGQIEIAMDLTNAIKGMIQLEWPRFEPKSKKEIADSIYKFTHCIVNLTKFLKTFTPTKINLEGIDGVDLKLLEEAVKETEEAEDE